MRRWIEWTTPAAIAEQKAEDDRASTAAPPAPQEDPGLRGMEDVSPSMQTRRVTAPLPPPRHRTRGTAPTGADLFTEIPDRKAQPRAR
jgi:hypothetical protein